MAKIVIDGLTDKNIEGLCRKWGYPVTVLEEKEVDLPDPDPKSEKGSTIKEKKLVEVPNPQPKIDFVKERILGYAKNEYLLQVRKDKKDASDKDADAEVEKEFKAR